MSPSPPRARGSAPTPRSPSCIARPAARRSALRPNRSAMANRPHIVIVGAGFGGLSAAHALAGAAADVTVIDRRNYHLFQPLLYQVATAGLSPAQIAQPIRSFLGTAPNE